MEERCPAPEYDRILAWLRVRYYGAWGLAFLGGTVLLGAWVMAGFQGIPVYGVTRGSLLLHIAIGLALYSAALALYARSKGLPWAWGLLGLGCVFGWIVLLALPKRCRYCSRSPAGRGIDCRHCGAPI